LFDFSDLALAFQLVTRMHCLQISGLRDAHRYAKSISY